MRIYVHIQDREAKAVTKGCTLAKSDYSMVHQDGLMQKFQRQSQTTSPWRIHFYLYTYRVLHKKQSLCAKVADSLCHFDALCCSWEPLMDL